MPRAPKKQKSKSQPNRSKSTVSDQIVGISRAPSSVPVYKFRRVYQEIISGSVSTIVAYSPVFEINKLPSFTEFTSLFTQYRFARITVLFRPIQSTFSLVGPAVFPVINTVFDYTDAVALSGVTAAQQYPSWKQNTTSLTRPTFQISFVPRTTINSAFPSAATGAVSLPLNTFFTTSDTSVEFYGLKTVIEEFGSGVQIQVTVLVDLECKGVR